MGTSTSHTYGETVKFYVWQHSSIERGDGIGRTLSYFRLVPGDRCGFFLYTKVVSYSDGGRRGTSSICGSGVSLLVVYASTRLHIYFIFSSVNIRCFVYFTRCWFNIVEGNVNGNSEAVFMIKVVKLRYTDSFCIYTKCIRI